MTGVEVGAPAGIHTCVRQEFEGRRTLHMDERVEALICAMLRMPRVSRKLWYSHCLMSRHACEPSLRYVGVP